MKEAYVSYEISLLLDEKGFEEETTWYYNSKGFCEPFSAWVDAKPYDYSPMPTLQMACAWLREKNIFIYAEPFITDNLEGYKPWLRTFNSNWFNPLCKQGTFCYTSTYEEAVEAALKYALENLI